MSSKKARRSVSDLGMAAYVKLHGFKCLGRKGRNFYFEVDEDSPRHNEMSFDHLTVEYVNSPMHEFDSAIMSLKKMGEFLQD